MDAQKQRKKEWSRQYYIDNKKEIDERNAEYRKQKPEMEKIRYKHYRSAHSARMNEMKEYMGGKCERCNHGILNHLEFCHYNPNEKVYNVSTMLLVDDETFCLETYKCHLLCRNCHYDETQEQRQTGLIYRGLGESRKKQKTDVL